MREYTQKGTNRILESAVDCVQAMEVLGRVLWRYIMEDSRRQGSLLSHSSIAAENFLYITR